MGAKKDAGKKAASGGATSASGAGGDAEAALASGRVEEAARLWRLALAQDAGDVRALVGIGRTAYLLGRLDDAQEALARAIARSPRDRDANLYGGVMAEAQGDVAKALERYRVAVEIDGKHMLARFHLGRALGVLQLYDEAVPELEEAVRLAPEERLHDALYTLATLEESRGRTGSAIDALARAVEANPAFLDGYVTMAELLAKAGERDAAKRVLEQARSLFPRSGIVCDKQAALAAASGDLAGALDHLTRQIEVEPQNARAYLNLSVFSQLAGDLARAEKAAEKLAAIDPASWEAQFHLGSIYEAVGLVEKSKKRLETACKLGPKAWQPRNDLGRILAGEKEKDRIGEGAKLLEEACRLAPAEEPAPRLNLALARLALGDRKKAASLLKELLRTAPEGHRLLAQAKDALAVAEGK